MDLFDFSIVFLCLWRCFLRWTFMGYHGRQMARLWHEIDSGSCLYYIPLGKGCNLYCSKNVQVQNTSFSLPNFISTKSPNRRVRMIFCSTAKFPRQILKKVVYLWKQVLNLHRVSFKFQLRTHVVESEMLSSLKKVMNFFRIFLEYFEKKLAGISQVVKSVYSLIRVNPICALW